MPKTELIALLKSLNNKELKQIEKLLQSPDPGNRTLLLQFFRILRKYHPHFSEDSFQKEKVYALLFPGVQFSDNRWHKRCSSLAKYIREYLITEQLKKREDLKWRLLMENLSQRENQEAYRSLLNKWIRERENQGLGLEHYFDRFWFNWIQFANIQEEKGQAEVPFMQQMIDAISEFCQYFYLRANCEYHFRADMFRESGLEFPKSWEQHQSGGEEQTSGFISLYGDLLALCRDPLNPSKASQLIRDFKGQYQSWDKMEQQAFLLYILNYAIQLLRRGQDFFLDQQFALTAWGIETGILTTNNQLIEDVFINCALIAIKKEKFDFYHEFVGKYQGLLAPQHQKNAVAICHGYLFFYQKDFEKASVELEKVNSRLEKYQIRKHPLSLRVCFEEFLTGKRAEDEMVTKLDSFRKFLSRRKSLSDTKKVELRNLAWFLKKLSLPRHQRKNNLKLQDQLLTELRKRPVVVKTWIEEKIEESLK